MALAVFIVVKPASHSSRADLAVAGNAKVQAAVTTEICRGRGAVSDEKPDSLRSSRVGKP
jgi:hypothetical protein